MAEISSEDRRQYPLLLRMLPVSRRVQVKLPMTNLPPSQERQAAVPPDPAWCWVTDVRAVCPAGVKNFFYMCKGDAVWSCEPGCLDVLQQTWSDLYRDVNGSYSFLVAAAGRALSSGFPWSVRSRSQRLLQKLDIVRWKNY